MTEITPAVLRENSKWGPTFLAIHEALSIADRLEEGERLELQNADERAANVFLRDLLAKAEAENARLREALTTITKTPNAFRKQDIARTALEESKP